MVNGVRTSTKFIRQLRWFSTPKSRRYRYGSHADARRSCTPSVSSTISRMGSRWFVYRLEPFVTRIELMHRRVWLGLRNSVRSAALKAMKSPTWWPSVWAIVARSPARMRQRRACPAGITISRVSLLMVSSSWSRSVPALGGRRRAQPLVARRRVGMRRRVGRARPQQPPEKGPGPLLSRPAEDLGWHALLDDPAPVHEDDPIAHLAGEVQLVGHHDHRHAGARQLPHRLEDLVHE